MSDDILHSSTSNDRVQKSNGSISGPSGTPNPRSCVTCRKRKVKCDKKHPCTNCARAKIECIYPGPGRAPRKSRKPPDGELMERLKKLEGVVQTLNAQVEEHEQESADKERRESRQGSSEGCPSSASRESPSVAVDSSVEGLESRFGRLVVDKGRSRYINNSFWASLNNEVEDLKAILIEPSDDDDEDSHDSPVTNYSSQHQGFVFGYSSTSVDMLSLHPSLDRARDYWEVYKENVDPLVKVLHVPTFEPTFLDAITHPEKVSRALECLLFAIYYGAVTSIMPKECMERWGEDRTHMLERYRFGLEQALARANFLYCDEIVILQSFVVFLMLLRRNDDARKIWTLTGLAVRIAQTLGIHRDGAHFDLPPFEIEMRRRLWWQVCILDARSSEDHGCDPTIVEAQFDTKMPLNINDTDLEPSMKAFPEERIGFTDMTFCLIRFEVANIFRRILYVPPGPNRCNQFFATLTIPEKEKWISECHQRLEDKYLKNCDMSIPLYWVTATISRLVMSKMWLIVYHPHQRRDGGASLPQETKDKLFITSLENIEYSLLLETEARTMKWGWLFRTYVQWHAIAFLLSELCVRTKGEAVDRAWRALEATAGKWWFPLTEQNYRKGKQGCLWKPLRKLMTKARAAREREMALERASQALRNGGVTYSDFPQMLSQIPDPPTTDQPSPENLDKLLRPRAPMLGEMPVANPPSWAGSPATRNLESPMIDGVSGFPTPDTGSFDNNGNGLSPEAQKLQDLTNYGLDYLLHDVMHGLNTDGTPYDGPNSIDNSVPGFMQQQPQAVNQLLNSSNNIQMNGATAYPSNSFNPNVGPFGGMFNDSPTGRGSGQSSGSPNLENDGMDWTIFDDLARGEFGMDGIPGQMTTNGAAGHIGMLNFF
ncbi:fungal-specific transcription factor domain-containing protein [Lophiotrema nucula]|uniref:Fungal-specific transcription factor domain-containing protein n=1 Tax=Lophiotrema nucula TaxID=690887 RepID=A0A6A5ZJH6_9PLEO|nr:fungal-specific transcription factor domain-containing protein [Lophiotrema nucula]